MTDPLLKPLNRATPPVPPSPLLMQGAGELAVSAIFLARRRHLNL